MKNIKNRKEMDPISLWGVTLASLLLVVLLCAVTAPIDRNHPSFTNPKAYPYDLHKYIFMADHPFQLRIAPFCYRILLPLIIHGLPVDRFHGFYGMTVLSLVVTGIIVFFILKHLQFDLYGCYIGLIVFYATGYLVKFNIFATWHVDAFSYVFVALAFWFILKNQTWPLAITILLGSLAKETVLFVLPLYYTFHASRLFDLRLLFKTGLIGIPAVLVLLGLRLVWSPLNHDERYVKTIPYEVSVIHVLSDNAEINRTHELSKLFPLIGAQRFKEMSGADLKRYLFGVWGALLVCIFLAPKTNAIFFMKSLPFLLLVYSQLLFGANTERLLALSFPVMIPMIVSGMRYVGRLLKIHPLHLLPLPLLYYILELLVRSDYNFSPELRIQLYILLLWLVYLFAISDLGDRPFKRQNRNL